MHIYTLFPYHFTYFSFFHIFLNSCPINFSLRIFVVSEGLMVDKFLLNVSHSRNKVFFFQKEYLSYYDVASGSEITPCNKICKPLVVYRFSGNVMTSITTLRTS